MKVCDCGGMWYRHGTSYTKQGKESIRYRCKQCKSCITVRDGQIVKGNSTGPRIRDWRYE